MKSNGNLFFNVVASLASSIDIINTLFAGLFFSKFCHPENYLLFVTMEDNKKVFKFFRRTGEDYQLWAARTKAAFCAKEGGSTIETDVLSQDSVDDDSKKNIATACATIIQGLGDKPLRLCLVGQNDPYKMWHRLRDRYAVSNTATRVQTKLTYSGQSMGDFVDSFEKIFNKLAGMDSTVSEELQVAIFLSSFGDLNQSRFGHAISSLQNIQDSLSWETAMSRLLHSYDDAIWHSESHRSSVSKNVSGHSQALVASKNNMDKWYGRNRSSGRVERRRCFNCNQIGHLDRNCPEIGKSVKGKTGNCDKIHFPSEAEHVNDSKLASAATLLLASVGEEYFDCRRVDSQEESLMFRLSEAESKSKLLLESGASDHMVPHLE